MRPGPENAQNELPWLTFAHTKVIIHIDPLLYSVQHKQTEVNGALEKPKVDGTGLRDLLRLKRSIA